MAFTASARHAHLVVDKDFKDFNCELASAKKKLTTFCFLLVTSIHLQAPGLSSGHSSERIRSYCTAPCT
ncbi:unnamed protein product [Ixodes hexagonus]